MLTCWTLDKTFDEVTECSYDTVELRCRYNSDRGHAFERGNLDKELLRLLNQPHVVNSHRRLRGQRLDEDFLPAGKGDHIF
tara:strand:- start:477 stop:719 length:243 start_codon:yes stop_codon:yes gene_type:complete